MTGVELLMSVFALMVIATCSIGLVIVRVYTGNSPAIPRIPVYSF